MSTSSADSDYPVADMIAEVQKRIESAVPEGQKPPRLVAVSKTKPVPLLMEAYNAGMRNFGENYAQEVLAKGPEMPDDVKWHFIGHLQTRNAKKLVKSVPNLYMIETVDSVKLANKLHQATQEAMAAGTRPGRLNVMVQVDTSGEDTKSGVSYTPYDEEGGTAKGKSEGGNSDGEDGGGGGGEGGEGGPSPFPPPTSELDALVQYILHNCKRGLNLCGLMTIGAIGDVTAFDRLRQCRDGVQEKYADAIREGRKQDGGREENADEDGDGGGDLLELSMGMSGDFEEGIKRGSTSVRVGSLIFGQRDYSNKK